MAKLLSARIAYNNILRTSIPSTNISRSNAIPNSLRIPEKSSDSEMLRNLRIAVSPSYGYGSNTYENATTTPCSSGLAGDPKRLQNRQDIRAEILEKWNKRPRPDMHREWMKNVMFN